LKKNYQQLIIAIKNLFKIENLKKKLEDKGMKEYAKNLILNKNTEKLVDIFKYYS